MYLKNYELDDQFESQIEELLDEGQQEAERILGRYLKGGLIRRLMTICCQLNNFELPGSSRTDSSPDSRAAATITRRLPRLSAANLFACVYLFSALGLIITDNYQQRYDYYKYHQKRLRSELASLNQSSEQARGHQVDELRAFIDAKVASSLADLERIGCPLRESSFSGQFTFRAWLGVSFCSYFLAVLFRKRLKGLDSYLVSAIIDRRAGELRTRCLIRQEFNAFIRSSQSYTEATISRYVKMNPTSDLDLKPNSSLRLLILDYKSTALSLRSMISNSLLLINRSPSHLLMLLKFCLYEYLFFFLVTILLFCCVLFSFILFKLLFMKLNTLMDWLVLLQFTFIVFTTGFSTACYLNLLHVSWLDQNKLLGQLDRKVQLSTRRIELLRNQLAASAALVDLISGPNRSRRLEANEQLLQVLLDYRLVLKQFGHIRHLLYYVALVHLAILYTTPLMARAHSPYVSAEARYAMIAWSVYCLSFTLPSIFIVCQLGERCLRIYRSLSKLLAHAIGLTAIGQGQLEFFFDQHTLWTLRQELSHPELVKERLAPHFMFVSFTYPNLIRFVFYYGLIVLSILVESGSLLKDSIFAGLLGDPLGIFRPDPSWPSKSIGNHSFRSASCQCCFSLQNT